MYRPPTSPVLEASTVNDRFPDFIGTGFYIYEEYLFCKDKKRREVT